MKKHIFYALLAVILPFAVNKSMAQVTIKSNITKQPLWGPAGYEQADYYYLPDVECYYNIAVRRFVYKNNGHWLFSPTLPPAYKNYDLYAGYKVVMNNNPTPYLNYDTDHLLYAKFKDIKGKQKTLRDARGKNTGTVKKQGAAGDYGP